MRVLSKFAPLLVMSLLSLILCQEVTASDFKGGKTLLTVEERSHQSAWGLFKDPACESKVQAALLGDQDTLKYDDDTDTLLYYFPIPDLYGDDLFNVRFTPAWDYQLKSALFSFYNKIGTGAVRIYVWEDTNGYPAQKIDSVDVPHANIHLFPDWTRVDFSSKNVTLRNLLDFHVGYTPLGPPSTDTVAILSDDGEPVGTEHRSVEYCDGAWETIYDGWGYDVNFLIRAVVEKSSEVEEEFTVVNPTRYELFQNYPNPFNPETKIKYTVGSRQTRPIPTTLKIYNILGQLVKTLLDKQQEPGNYEIIWDGKDDKGNEAASGIYFYQLKAGEFSQTEKMVLIR